MAVATGVCLKNVSARQTFRLSWHFGLFQALMPILGWLSGSLLERYLARIDHWIAFGLLAFIGVRMLLENPESGSSNDRCKDPTRGMSLILLSVATSIDALAVGFSMSMLQNSIWYAAGIIGIVAGVFTLVGLHLGRLISAISQIARYATVLGGSILIGIGVKILFEHGAFTVIFS